MTFGGSQPPHLCQADFNLTKVYLSLAWLAWADILCFGRLIPETRGVSLEQMDNLFAEFRGTQTAKVGDSLKGSGGDSLMSQQAPTDVATL